MELREQQRDDHIESIAREFRLGIERADFSNSGTLKKFPAECCEFVSELLGAFLVACGRVGRLIKGNRPDGDGSHLWLELDGLVLDITADQFPFENQPSVVVTRDSSWHRSLNGTAVATIDRVYIDDMRKREQGCELYTDWYNRILDANPTLREFYN